MRLDISVLRVARIVALSILLSAMALIVAACGDDSTPTPRPPAATATPTAASSGGDTTAAPKPTATAAPKVVPATPTPTPVTFGDKTIRITVGYSPGGGFDTFARIFAVHLSDSLPGKPNVIVSNLPGANTLVAAKSVIDKDYRANTVDVVLVIASLIQNELLSDVAGFSLDDLTFLGVADFRDSDQTFCVRSSVATSLDEMLNSGKTYTLAQIGQIDTYATTSKWAWQVGFPFNRVFGYSGTSDMNAAFNRGEVEVTPTCRQSEVLLNPEWADGYATPLFYTRAESPWITEGKAAGKWGWVDAYSNIAKEKLNATQAQVDGIEGLLDISAATRVFSMPAKTPAPIVAAMREAFVEVANSQPFIDDMVKRGFDVGVKNGDEYQELVNGLTKLPPKTLDVIRGLFPES